MKYPGAIFLSERRAGGGYPTGMLDVLWDERKLYSDSVEYRPANDIEDALEEVARLRTVLEIIATPYPHDARALAVAALKGG